MHNFIGLTQFSMNAHVNIDKMSTALERTLRRIIPLFCEIDDFFRSEDQDNLVFGFDFDFRLRMLTILYECLMAFPDLYEGTLRNIA